MTFQASNRSHVYLGEFASDADALAYIRNNTWDTSGDGGGNPQNGMQYYNTTTPALRVYINGSWVTFTTS